jgi:hypothetical protein
MGTMMRQSSKRKRQSPVSDVVSVLEERLLLSVGSRPFPDASPSHIAVMSRSDWGARSPLHEARTHTATPVAAQLSHHGASTSPAPTVNRWSWFTNTYWYVPSPNVPATLFNVKAGTLQPIQDQTVFHITGYRLGYFWGSTVTQFGSNAPTASTMNGTVTPEGKVLLTFTSTGNGSSPSITQGFGTMHRKFGQWTMENQMSSSPNQQFQISHWAYMVQTRPGQSSWSSLPFVNVSVPTFSSEANAAAAVPIVTPG